MQAAECKQKKIRLEKLKRGDYKRECNLIFDLKKHGWFLIDHSL